MSTIFCTISICYIVAPAKSLPPASLHLERAYGTASPAAIKVQVKWPILFSGNAATSSAGASPSPGSLTGGKRGDGSPEGQKQFRAKVEQLRQKYIRHQALEIEKIKDEEN